MSYSIDKNQEGVTKGKTRYRFNYNNINGTRSRKKIQCYPSQVADLYRKWEREQDTGTPKAKRHKLFEMIDKYLDYVEERRNRKYFLSHLNELTFFKFFLDDIPVDDIRRFHIKDYRDWRKSRSNRLCKKVVKPRTVNFSIAVLSIFFNWMIDREYYSRVNPAARQKTSDDNLRHIVLEQHQIAELLRKATASSGWMYTGVVLALFAGLRKQEILELKWTDIDSLRGLINLRAEMTKTKKQRFVPLPDFLAAHLSSLQKDGDWIMMDHGERIMYSKFRFSWDRLRNSLTFATLSNGLVLTFHDLRHVYAQSLRDAGITLGDIQAYLGHSTVELTIRRYAQRGGIDGKAKVNRLSEVYNVH